MAARLGQQAFAMEPKLAADMMTPRRYNAACYAALAGCGEGKDRPPPDEAARAALRHQALDWLNADLAAWSEIVARGSPESRSKARRTSPALAGRQRPGRRPRPLGPGQAPRGRADPLVRPLVRRGPTPGEDAGRPGPPAARPFGTRGAPGSPLIAAA